MINIKKLLISLFNLEFYTSPLDQFLAALSKKHPNLTASERKEKDKYSNIFNHSNTTSPDAKQSAKLWNKF